MLKCPAVLYALQIVYNPLLLPPSPACPAAAVFCSAPQAFDAPELGEWVHRLRRLRSEGRLPEGLAARLEGVGFAWRVDGITAKWYHNLHVARRYKVLYRAVPSSTRAVVAG